LFGYSGQAAGLMQALVEAEPGEEPPMKILLARVPC
jgi:hypothetical protein